MEASEAARASGWPNPRFTTSHGIGPWFEAFRRRKVVVNLRSIDHFEHEFREVVDYATVLFSKTHGDGTVTRGSIILDSTTVTNGSPGFRYGWYGESGVKDWRHYRYRVVWNFTTGTRHDTGWVDAAESLINLYPPYQRRFVQLVGDSAALRSRGVRAVVIEVSYPFFGESRSQKRVVRLDRPLENEAIELTLPRGEFAYNYKITWHMGDGKNLTATGTYDGGLFLIDQLPTEEGE